MLITIPQVTLQELLDYSNIKSLGPKTIECVVIVSAEAHGRGNSKEEMKEGQMPLDPVKGVIFGSR